MAGWLRLGKHRTASSGPSLLRCLCFVRPNALRQAARWASRLESGRPTNAAPHAVLTGLGAAETDGEPGPESHLMRYARDAVLRGGPRGRSRTSHSGRRPVTAPPSGLGPAGKGCGPWPFRPRASAVARNGSHGCRMAGVPGGRLTNVDGHPAAPHKPGLQAGPPVRRRRLRPGLATTGAARWLPGTPAGGSRRVTGFQSCAGCCGTLSRARRLTYWPRRCTRCCYWPAIRPTPPPRGPRSPG